MAKLDNRFRIPVPCANCGEYVPKSPYELRRYTNHFCDQKCRGEYVAKTKMFAKSKNPYWKGGLTRDKYHYKKIQVDRYPEKIKCRNLFAYHIKAGNITRKPCEICGEPDAEGHHEDYRFPLKVRWMCTKHHRAYHNGKIKLKKK